MSVKIVGYPRSGNQWAGWVCRYLLLDGVQDKAVMRHYHAANMITGDTPLVFQLRNYKEAIVRHFQHSGMTRQEQGLDKWFDEVMVHPKVNYVDLVMAFHGYKGKKFLNVYEDMISDPLEQGLKLSWFVGADRKRTREMADNWDAEMAECVRVANGASKKTYTAIEHSEALSDDQKHEWDRRIKDRVGDEVWELYLKRYACPPSK